MENRFLSLDVPGYDVQERIHSKPRPPNKQSLVSESDIHNRSVEVVSVNDVLEQ